MKRRALLTGLASLSGLLAAGTSPTLAQAEREAMKLKSVWTAWRNANLDATGRVVDLLQQSASHSEGQGYGMLLAAYAGDARAFAAMETWARINLAIRPDALMAWRWLDDRPDKVPDTNNASDGDLFRAWALLKGFERFGVDEYRTRAAAITHDLAAKCIAMHPGTGASLLMPAVHGFRTTAGFVYNPSYAMPLALTELAQAFDVPALADAAANGLAMADQLAAGGVVPDWVEVTPAGPQPATGFSYEAGYEAIRVPLFLIWSGQGTHRAVSRYVAAQKAVPAGEVATVISRTGEDILQTTSAAGYRAVAALATCATDGGIGTEIPPYVPSAPYYPATLHLFAMLAQMEAVPRCLPI